MRKGVKINEVSLHSSKNYRIYLTIFNFAASKNQQEWKISASKFLRIHSEGQAHSYVCRVGMLQLQ